MTEHCLTTEEVAARYRTTPPTVRYWRRIGYGPAGFKVGGRVLDAASDVASWMVQVRREACLRSCIE